MRLYMNDSIKNKIKINFILQVQASPCAFKPFYFIVETFKFKDHCLKHFWKQESTCPSDPLDFYICDVKIIFHDF